MGNRLLRRRGVAGIAAFASALAVGGVAIADVATNTLDTTIDPAKETMNLTVGTPGTTNLYVANVNSNNALPYADPVSGTYTDTVNNCNLSGSNYVTIGLSSSDTAVATVPASVKIDDCDVSNAKQITVTPVGPGTATISATIVGSESSYSGTIDTNAVDFTVNVAGVATNQAPTANAGGPYSGAEGSAIALSGSGTDSDGTIASYAWSYTVDSADSGATCTFGNVAAAATSFTCTDDGTYSVSLITTDDDSATSPVSTATVTVSNANPTATKSFGASVTEGSAFSLALTGGTDPGSNDSLTYQFDCGDGAGYGTESTTAGASCPTTDNGTRSVRAKIIDDDGGSTEYSDSVTVNNAPPVLGALTQTGGTNCSPTYGTTYSDAGTADTHEADWGDGFAAVSGGSVSKTFDFGSAGIQSISVTLRDDDGGTDTASTTHETLNIPSGILQPINTGTSRSQFKLGSTVPVKITVTSCAGQSVGTLLPAVSIVRLDSDPNDPDTVVETPYTATPTNGQNMRYDSVAQQYIYNLSTKNLTQGTWKVSVDDGSFAEPVTAVFNIKK